MARLVRGDRSHIDGAAQVWAEATAFRDGDPDVAPLEDSRPIIAGVAGRPRSVLIVALDDQGQVMAFAVAAPVLEGTDDLASTAEVEYVGVRPGGWGTGLARGVLELLCAELAADGFTRAQLLVYVSNQRAVGVYERLGWQAEGSPRPHRQTGKPEQRYRRTLGDEAGRHDFPGDNSAAQASRRAH
jgi:ribosomal protein S18 acetylase RimI-like enzyme